MPKLKVEHIVSFSSEDPVHVANNILNIDATKKWKCKTAGETQAYVILQLEKASVITGIDIGNEHSAYVEVLVARSGSSNDSDYKLLLVMSSFMTPIESRQSTNTSKVRMFTVDQLCAPEREEKWDRVKIVCTQPFNRHVQYGLAFVTLHTSQSEGGSAQTGTIGKFAIRPPSPNDLFVGSMFAKRKERQDSPVTAATAIRQASASASPGSKTFEPNLTPKQKKPPTDSPTQSKNRNEVLYDDEDEQPNAKIDKIMEQKKKEDEEKKLKKEKENTNSNKKKEKDSTSKKTKDKAKKEDKKDSPAAAKRKLNVEEKKPNKKPKKMAKPFKELLGGVALVISGIQNPQRANIRSKALEMGAKYKPDWDNTCTHLICAFPNTPKFNQVRGKGKIVTQKWVDDCYTQRKRLPWRRYALDRNDQGKDESEEEISELVEEERDDSDVEAIENPEIQTIEVDDDEQGVEDCDSVKDEGSDTEMRIQRIRDAESKKDLRASEDPYDAQTNEETLPDSPKNPEDLPDFFAGTVFYADPSLGEQQVKFLDRYVTAYGGKSSKNVEDDIDVIVAEKSCVEDLKSIFGDTVVYVNPGFVWECHNRKKLLEYGEFKC